MTDPGHGICLLSSSYGPVALVWSESEASNAEKVALRAFPDARRASCLQVDRTAGAIARFLSGRAVRFSLGSIRIEACSRFQQQVLRAEHAIPRGRVTTYGRIASHLGNPAGARAVGRALARNPFPIIIPCHRALCSDGSPGGFQGGTAMKRALLEMEGIEFDERGRATVKKFWY
jgi:methylated-DNA-[protein]-cysteine S-methyltransferase